MTLTEQVKILDDKVRANKDQYELDREAAKISALSSGELEKYDYLTSEDLGYKPDVIHKAKFEYSPLGKVFNKGLDESDKKEGLLKRLKNIEGKNEQQLLAIKNQKKKSKTIKDQKENKSKIIEKEGKIMYLENEIDKLFKTYPNSFTSQGKSLLKIHTNSEKKIDYKNLSYKILFPDSTFHITNFLEKYGTLLSLLESLTTKKVTVNSANSDQISFIINLMHGYDDWRLYGLRESKSEFFHNTILTSAKNNFFGY